MLIPSLFFTRLTFTGIFMSFSEGMDQCIRTSLPVLFMALTFLSLSFAKASHSMLGEELLGHQQNATESPKSFTKNELLLGSHDPFFWFLIPLFGLICVGVCIAANYVVLALTQIFTVIYSRIRSVTLRNDEGRLVLILASSREMKLTVLQKNLYRFRSHLTYSTDRHYKHSASYGSDDHSLPIRLYGPLLGAVSYLHSCSPTSTRDSESLSYINC